MKKQTPPHVKKQVLKGMDLAELTSWITGMGEKPYRAKQVYQWMYQKGVLRFDEMTNISKDSIKLLGGTAELSTLTPVASSSSSSEPTRKILFRLHDGTHIESVYMEEKSRITICLSTQVGCSLNCGFCATGKMKFSRNLSTGEILDQYIRLSQIGKHPITNVVFMGMGEPLINYENTIKAAVILNSEAGPNIAAKKITVSTAGIVPNITRFSEEGHKFKLAISLNAVEDGIRNRIMPINRKYPLNELLHATRHYTDVSKQRVTFEYILLPGINDSDDDARRLIQRLRHIPCKLNIIPYNPVKGFTVELPGERKLDRFISTLYNAPFAVTVRRSKGSDIKAACGQLALTGNNDDCFCGSYAPIHSK